MRLFLQKSVVSCLFLLACIGSVFGQLTVDFSASDSSGCGNVTPIFQDLTTSPGNPIVSWEWDFGDGTPHAFIQNPAHIYSDTIGCFDIKLIVTTNNGTVDSIIKPNFICVYPDPVIGPISINPAQACLPAIMTFTASVTSPTPINTWLWDIPGSQLQYGQTVVDTFTTSGILDITLLIQDANGCFADTIFDNVVSILPSPAANFIAVPTSACAAPFTTNFSSTSTLNGGTVPAGTTYQWSFPGGIPANSTQQNPSGITYNSPGNFDVTLSIVSPNGCTDTITKTGFIGVGQVIAGIDVGAITCVGQPISLDGTGASSYTWDFDCNGTTDATGSSTTVTYNAPGTYCVKVTASNGPGCNDDEQVQIVVNPSPTASFVVDRTIDCKVPTTSPFLFNASASVGATSYTWTFGPGATPTNPFITANPQVGVLYSLPGFKTVRLIAVNASGCRDTVNMPNLIQVAEPTANFTADKTEGCLPINIAFTSTSISIDPIASYQWLITPSAGTIPNPIPGIANPTVQFNNPGDYDVQLIVITQLGCRDTLLRSQYIGLGAHPQMGMTYNDSVICINEAIQFNSTVTDPNWQYAWDFNYTAPSFNIMSSLPNPLYAFPDTGMLSVGLIINNNGCRDTLIKDDLVFVKGPKAAFSVDPTVACGLPATFDITNNSSNALTGNTTYAWYFNNMVTPYTPIVTKNPLQPPVDPLSPTYGGAPQQITIKLIVTGITTGCVDSLKQTVVVGNPIANFTVPDQIICRNSDATFNITGANATNYEWDFGDNTTATSTGNTTHTYTSIDTFTVTLIAIDANSCRDTLVKPLHIRVTGPIPDFTSPDTVGCTPFTTSFVNTSVLYPGTTQTNVEWNFYNPNVFGNAGNNNPSHTFSPNGIYNVSIRVTDSDGCVAGWTEQQYISATFPDTQFNANDTVTCAGNLVTFTPVIPGNTYTWSFGDSTGVTHFSSGTGAIQHSFPAVGQYTVTLTVTDVNGCVDSLVKMNYITIESYTADFTGSPTSAACPPLATFFQDQSSGNIAGWEWIFGDNTLNATLQNPGHIYTAAGNFDVSLVVTHVDGCKDTVTKPNFITLDGPIGFVTISDTTVCPGDTVHFTITTNNTASIFPELQPGNAFFIPTNTTSNDTINLYYVYTLPGIYPSKFLIQDPAGCSYTIPNVPNVTIYQPPVAAFDMTPPAGCTPLTVSFTNNSTPGVGQTGGGTIPPGGYSWSFDNGNSSTLQNPSSQTYMTPNVYNVTLFVTDNRACRDTLTQALPANYRPLANFTADDTIQCAPVQIQFNDLTSITVPVAWSWNFGDNGTANTANPNHLYQQDGNYTISLVVTDANGCMDTFTRTQYVYLRHPVADFVADSLYGCNPFQTCFDASSTQTDTLIDTYNWQFGLGQGTQLSNADSICHTYSVPGTYTVTLTVTDVLGCADDLVRTNYITIDQTTTPDTMEILTATVVNRNKVRVDFIPYFQTDFRKYLLYRKTPQGWLAVDSTTIQNSSSLFDYDTTSFDCEALSYCYAMVVENDCRKRSPISMNKAHCTMLLSTGPQIDAIKLTWTPYKGWNNVLQYDIYKIPAGHVYYPNINNMVLLGSVAGNVNTFQDTTTFCEDSVHYRVVALELGGEQQESFSNVDGNKAKHFAPTEGVEMQYVTVVDNKDIEIKWVEYPGYKPAYYVLEKSLGGDVWKEIATNIPLTTLSYTDTDVYVDSLSYRYRVFADDSCGYRSRPYNIGRSIVLDANQLEDETPVLTWNIYEKWVDAGVEYYEIQVWDENNGWVMVDVVGPQTTRYVDTKTSFFQSIYNYRIIAHELAGYHSISVSNEDSIVFTPKIWSANAFTPNRDGKNDVFVVKGPFDLSTFTLVIFDRWGRIIFESRDISQGWDGTVKGKDAPEGVYTYKVTAKGLKGEPVYQNGTVTLVR